MGVALRRLGVKGIEVRKTEQLEKVPSLVIPGGESTTMAKLAHYHNLFPALREFVRMGKPVWGTCAGLIFLANKAVDGFPFFHPCLYDQLSKIMKKCDLNKVDYVCFQDRRKVDRNLWEALIVRCRGTSSVVSYKASKHVFQCQNSHQRKETPKHSAEFLYVLLPFLKQGGGHGSEKVNVVVRHGNLLGTAFHPELTADSRWHSYFLKIAMVESTPPGLSPRAPKPPRYQKKKIAMEVEEGT